MSLLIWNDKLALGIPAMDEQHQQWITLMNALHDAIQKGREADLVDQTIMGMLDYARSHFVDEEQLLFEHGYPDLAHHKMLHDDFVRQLENLQQSKAQAGQSDWLLIMDIIKMASDWLTHHIQRVDQQYASFLKEKGVDFNP
jgi:hemerythrin